MRQPDKPLENLFQEASQRWPRSEGFTVEFLAVLREMQQWEALGTAIAFRFACNKQLPGSLARAFRADFPFWTELQVNDKPAIEQAALSNMLDNLANRYCRDLCEPERYRKLWNVSLPALARRFQEDYLRTWKQEHEEMLAPIIAPRQRASADSSHSVSRSREGPRRELLAAPEWLEQSIGFASQSAEEEFFARESAIESSGNEDMELATAIAHLPKSERDAVTECLAAMQDETYVPSGKMGDSLRQLWGDNYSRKRQALLRAKRRSKVIRDRLQGSKKEASNKKYLPPKGLMSAWRRMMACYPEHKAGFEALARRECHPVSELDISPALQQQIKAANAKMVEFLREDLVTEERFAKRMAEIEPWMKYYSRKALASKQLWFAHAAKWWAEYYCRSCFTIIFTEQGIHHYLNLIELEISRS